LRRWRRPSSPCTAATPPGSSSSGSSGSSLPPAASAPAQPAQAAGWRVLDWILVVVGVANLAGLVVVGRLAAGRSPRNPFK